MWIDPRVIAEIQAAEPGVDILWNPVLKRHVVVQRTKHPVAIDPKVRDALDAHDRLNEKQCFAQYLFVCEIENPETGETRPFAPHAQQIVEILRKCSLRADDESGFRKIQDDNDAIDRKHRENFRRTCRDIAKEALTRLRWGSKYNVPGSTMVKDIRS